MTEIIFQVQGSASEPYVVQFKKDGNSLNANCSCPAGGPAQCCKHRIRIIEGSDEGIVSGNEADVSTIVSWAQNTEVEATMTELRKAEERFEDAKKGVSALKKKLARVLHG